MQCKCTTLVYFFIILAHLVNCKQYGRNQEKLMFPCNKEDYFFQSDLAWMLLLEEAHIQSLDSHLIISRKVCSKNIPNRTKIQANCNTLYSLIALCKLNCFFKVIDDAPEVIRAVRKDEACGKVHEEKQTWDDLNVVTVTCLTEGTGNFALMVGNYLREESKDA